MSKKVMNLVGHKVTPTEEEFAYSDEIHATFIEPPKVPVKVFKEQFFDGLRKQDKDVRNEWIDKVNNMYGRVNLTDENGEVITWVPPMAYGLVSKNSNKLDEAAYTHRATKELHGSAAEGNLAKAIQENIMIQSPPRSHIEQWKKLITMLDPDAKVKSVVEKGIVEDTNEYEEW